MKSTLIPAYCLLLILLAPLVLQTLSATRAADVEIRTPVPAGCDEAEPTADGPELRGADQIWRWRWVCRDLDAELHVFRFNSQAPGKEATGGIQAAAYDRSEFARFSEVIDDRRVRVWETQRGHSLWAEWLIVDQRATPNHLWSKVLEVASLMRTGRAAVTRVVVHIDTANTNRGAGAAMLASLDELADALELEYLRACDVKPGD